MSKENQSAQQEGSTAFSWKELFSEVFSSHSAEELEQYWAAGTIGNIPTIDNVSVECPKPWAFVRIFLTSLVTYLIFWFCWLKFQNPNVLPGLIIIGTAVIPLSVLTFFFEINVRRNVSMYIVLKLLILGGALSIVFSLFMYQITEKLGLSWLGASVAGIAEETGKLLVLMLVINSLRYPYILNGLLFGAAVGAGFSAFESAGYALTALLSDITTGMGSTQVNASINHQMIGNIALRAFLSPFGHIIWTAMAAGALWRVKGKNKFEISMIFDIRFLLFFLAAMILHMVWNCRWTPDFVTPFDKYIVLGIVGWLLIGYLIRQGLRQLAEEKSFYRETPQNEPGVSSVIQAQTIYAGRLVKRPSFMERKSSYVSPAEPSPVSPAAEPKPAELPPSGVSERTAVAGPKESPRDRPNFSDRAWKKYYSRNEKEDDHVR